MRKPGKFARRKHQERTQLAPTTRNKHTTNGHGLEVADDVREREPARRQRVAEDTMSTKNMHQTEPMIAQKTRNILVADDDSAIREVVKTLLEDEGYQVSEAATGQEALDGLKAGTFELLILDMRMPGMTGLDVLQTLRQQEGELPVILMTAHGSPNIAIQASSLGAYGYISKPFEADDVLNMIRHYFE